MSLPSSPPRPAHSSPVRCSNGPGLTPWINRSISQAARVITRTIFNDPVASPINADAAEEPPSSLPRSSPCPATHYGQPIDFQQTTVPILSVEDRYHSEKDLIRAGFNVTEVSNWEDDRIKERKQCHTEPGPEQVSGVSDTSGPATDLNRTSSSMQQRRAAR